MALLAVITKRELIERILSHLRVPLSRAPESESGIVSYDVTGESIGDWVVGVDPDPDERGPPADYDGVDPPGQHE